MKDEKYNGWTNWETWKINLEIFDGWNTEGEKADPDYLRETAEEFLTQDVENSTVLGIVYSFLSAVNWYEIAEHLNDE